MDLKSHEMPHGARKNGDGEKFGTGWVVSRLFTLARGLALIIRPIDAA
jgi:hypothetical protein